MKRAKASDSRIRVMTDEELFLSLDANPDAFAVLVRRYERRMFLIAFRILRSRAVSEEAVQDTLMRIFLYRNSFRPEASFRKWADRIMVNSAIKELRHENKERKRRIEVENLDALPCRSESEENGNGLGHQTLRSRIESVLACMPESYAKVLRLHYLEGHTYPKIVEELGISRSAVKMLLLRARREFRGLFNKKPRQFFDE